MLVCHRRTLPVQLALGLEDPAATASGCPVVTTEVRALAKVAGDAALRVKPEDPQAIGDALLRVSSDADLRATLVRRGRDRAPRFSRAAQAGAMARVYRDFMAGLP